MNRQRTGEILGLRQPLIRVSVLGLQYGYASASAQRPGDLGSAVGDFVNGAQVIIDQ